MNVFKKILLILFLTNIVNLNTFAQQPKTAKAYFEKKSIVGIIVVTHLGYDEKVKTGPSGRYYFGAIAALFSTLSHDLHTTHINNGKYDNALKLIEPEITPQKRLSDLYTSIYMDQGKTVILIDEKFNERELEYFVKPTQQIKHYYEKDLRFLRELYKVDELLIVNMDYGVRVHKSYLLRNVELKRSSYSRISATLVNLNDNSIIIKTSSLSKKRLNIRWNVPPAYALLNSTIKNTIDIAISDQWRHYDWNAVKEAKEPYDPVY
jgi:hypothetical protein